MDTKELTPADVLRAWRDEDEEPEGYLLVEDGDWIDDGKYAYSTAVLKDIESGRHFAIHLTRCGSYFSDYDYLEPTCNEVWPVTVTRTEYSAQKPAGAAVA